MRIGVIADTHGYLDERIVELFQGVDYILHAGDIGSLEVIDRLLSLAPVIGVRGNGDFGIIRDKFPPTQVFLLRGRKVLLTHDLNQQRRWKERSALVTDGGADLIIFGHTHRPEQHYRGGTIYFNPGAASVKMCYLIPSIGILTIEEEIEARIINLN